MPTRSPRFDCEEQKLLRFCNLVDFQYPGTPTFRGEPVNFGLQPGLSGRNHQNVQIADTEQNCPLQITTASLYSPNCRRIASEISPTVAFASTAARILGIRF